MQENHERKKVNLFTCRILNVKISQLVIIRKFKMINYDLVIDISSDEEKRDSNVRQSTPIKILPLNVITTLDLSGSSLEATKVSTEEMMSSINDLNLSNISASTFETIGTPKKNNFWDNKPRRSVHSRSARRRNFQGKLFRRAGISSPAAHTTTSPSLTRYNERRLNSERASCEA